jgi:hypothetical protein
VQQNREELSIEAEGVSPEIRLVSRREGLVGQIKLRRTAGTAKLFG